MGITKLQLWNDALAAQGQAVLLATDEAGVAGATLAEMFDRTVLYCLEQGYWNFATKTATLATEGGTVLFGYTYPYQKPTGWMRTILLSANEDYWPPFEQYEDANDQIHADVSPLYMAYVDSVTALATEGNPITAPYDWPESFSTYVSMELAKRICRRIGGASDEYDRLVQLAKNARDDGLSKDATNEGVRYPPDGRWTMSRRGGTRGDRGRRGSLVG